MKYLGIDIGGTWLKGTVVSFRRSEYGKLQIDPGEVEKNTVKVESSLSEQTTIEEFIEVIKKVVDQLGANEQNVQGIGISTAGIIDYAGRKVLKTAAHLQILKNNNWIVALEKKFNCPVSVINDADAATIGIAESGFLKGNKTIGIMPVGTGLGFTVWRNGRRWRPGKMFALLGSVRTPVGYYDEIASASKLASNDAASDLIKVLTSQSYEKEKNSYIENLVDIINTAAIIYNLDEVMICGGLANAANVCNYPLEEQLNILLSEQQVELDKAVKATVLKQGNTLQLVGALMLAWGESVARKNQVVSEYESIPSENQYRKGIQLQELTTSELINTFWNAEQEAGEMLSKSFETLAEVIDKISEKVNNGGRIIYVGAGTSGRVAAMDTVEIPCTYGFPEDRILCLIAGGIADAAIEIESDFEEDVSAIPEILLMNLTENDSVIGISASGTAYFVQSALAFAKERGAYSVMIQSERGQINLPFCDTVIPLNSGYEVVAGSTRMKAGTATKKILNFISSSVMIKLGKVAGAHMIDVACINNKLVGRAQNILKTLYNIDKNEALEILKKENMNLGRVIQNMNRNPKNYE